MDPRRVGIIANTGKPGAAEVIQRLEHKFAQLGVVTATDEMTAELCGRQNGTPLGDLVDQVDLFVLLGGDGTILHFATELGPRVKPIAAINIGTLGFLTLGTASELNEVAELIAKGDFELSQRSVIALRVYHGDVLQDQFYALNEVSLSRGIVSRVVKVETRVNGDFVTRYSGDGLIIATPTGSTAYSLSAGGPIIQPTSGVFLINPVCPHALASRPLVVSDHSVIEITAPEQRDQVFMTVDGQHAQMLDSEKRLEIRRAEHQVPLVAAPNCSFFKILRQKLDWSGSNG